MVKRILITHSTKASNIYSNQSEHRYELNIALNKPKQKRVET